MLVQDSVSFDDQNNPLAIADLGTKDYPKEKTEHRIAVSPTLPERDCAPDVTLHVQSKRADNKNVSSEEEPSDAGTASQDCLRKRMRRSCEADKERLERRAFNRQWDRTRRAHKTSQGLERGATHRDKEL